MINRNINRMDNIFAVTSFQQYSQRAKLVERSESAGDGCCYPYPASVRSANEASLLRLYRELCQRRGGPTPRGRRLYRELTQQFVYYPEDFRGKVQSRRQRPGVPAPHNTPLETVSLASLNAPSALPTSCQTDYESSYLVPDRI